MEFFITPAPSVGVDVRDIETAARAMYEFEPWGDGTTWQTMPEAGKNSFRETMRFVFAALTPPSQQSGAVEVDTLRARIKELEQRINTPHTQDWVSAVQLEAAHQIERYGVDHDDGKSPSDWFWLIGYLGGKALSAAITDDIEKAKHHTISTGAALLNWHRNLIGETTAMRPGIAAPLPTTDTAEGVLK